MATQTEKEMRIKVEASEVIFEISSKVTKAIHDRCSDRRELKGMQGRLNRLRRTGLLLCCQFDRWLLHRSDWHGLG